jgi:hypothetical protein
MAKDDSRLQRRVDGSLWLPVDAESPLSSATSDVEVVPERQRWMAAPAFSKGRYQAKPMQQRIGWLRALIILVHDAMRPRDEVAERLHDIEALILGGHNDAADQQIARLRADYPGDDMKARVLGLVSLNLYDRGNEGKAQYIHEFAVLCGTAHPAMTEIFGDTVADPSPRLCPPIWRGCGPLHPVFS